MAQTSSLHLTCLCGSISEPGSLLSDQETPVYAEMCHCATCRYTTGALSVPFSPLKSSPSATTLNKLQAYASSDIATRYFCPTCGCSCVFYTAPRDQWYFMSGAIEYNPDIKAPAESRNNIFKVMRHAHILDTKDGGLAPFLLQLGDRSVPTWAGIPPPMSASQDSYDLPHEKILSMLGASSKSPTRPPQEDSYLTARCHCGGVNLLIKRANHAHGDRSRCNYPPDPTKYSTYLCACRSCRLSTGVSLYPWTLVNAENVFNGKTLTSTDGPARITFGFEASNPDANPGLSLKHYWSSHDTCRSFCGKCGAAISYWCAQRPDELDITVGILRSDDGSLARKWLGWTWGECSFSEGSTDMELYEAWTRAPGLIKEAVPAYLNS
ncbi:hypothetical protein TCE0_042f15054 [Talaromyces pinophilus]|jgi:hypothetical protein|uniref:CENP-V/GFA domain-containing protein n=1 Tax=Talaromyces pinophilus TaxID=128442 RepID=A0A6V8HJ51_TALPI|nr:hypothetical protein TCE0_042f15054 [Talaromyces pinophilus]